MSEVVDMDVWKWLNGKSEGGENDPGMQKWVTGIYERAKENAERDEAEAESDGEDDEPDWDPDSQEGLEDIAMLKRIAAHKGPERGQWILDHIEELKKAARKRKEASASD